MRKVHVKVVVDLLLSMDEGIEVSDVINEMDYSFTSLLDGAEIEETTIEDYEVRDSR